MGPKKRKKKLKSKVPVVPRNANLSYKFQEGDIVWCKWYSRYYRAIILRLTVELGGEHFYGIHYWKFAKSWDMTVSEDRLLAWTNENNKFVKKLHQELYQAKKKKKLEDKLISEIKKNITEKPIQQQYPFLSLTDLRPLLKGYVPSEVHHSAEESIQSSSSQFSQSLTFVIHDDHYELKNISIKTPTCMESVPEKNIEPMIVNKDCENQKMGLFKEFSSKEKDVINVLDNMRTNNLRFRSSSGQRNQEVEYEDSAMPKSKEHLRLDDLEDDSIDGSFNDGDDLMEYEKATSSKEEEELQCDQDYTSKNSSADHEPGCEVNNLLTTLNDEPCHISNIFVKDALSSELEKNINRNENTNFDINALLITENNLNNSKRSTCIMEEDETFYKSNVSKKVENLTKLENILIGKKSGLLTNSNLTKDKSTSFETTNLLIPTTTTNNKRIMNDLKHKTTDEGNYSHIKKAKANASISALNKKNQIDDHNSLITEDIISKDIISLNEHHSQSVIIPVSSIQITTETNINACEFENYEGIISKDISLNEYNDQSVAIPVSLTLPTSETNINEIELATSTEGIISKDISLNEYNDQSVAIPVSFIPPTSETNINEIELATSTEAIGYIKKPKLHKKQKNRKLRNVDIHINQDELVVSNSQLGIISKDILLNEYNDQSATISVPLIPPTSETNINEVELECSDVLGHLKTPKLHKKRNNKKLKNVDIHIDHDEFVVSNSQLGIISKDISLSKYNNQSDTIPVSLIPLTSKTNINEVELAYSEAFGHLKIPKLHKKRKNQKLKNSNIYIDQEIISKDISLNEYHDQSVIRPVPLLQRTIERNINEVELACSEAVGRMKKPKLHKKQKNRKLKNVDIFIDQDELVLSNSQLDVPFHNNISLNKLNHSVTSASSNIVITNNKEINDYKCETKKVNNMAKKEKSKNKHKKKKSKNEDIYVDQNNINTEFILEPQYDDNESSNKNDHSSTQINKRKIENEISYENEFKILKKTIESSSTESIDKEKIDDFEYEIYDDNLVENPEMLKKQEKKNSKNANHYLDKDDIFISENDLFPNQISHYTSNENWSCGSTSSSTSTSTILNTRTESDDDIDGHTTDDDDQYVKNRKVSKKKLKQSDDVDRNIYELFAYDKSYSRAAKVKANEAISQMSKPPISKEKKNDVGKRSKNGKKKEDEEPWNFQSKLSDYNLNVPNCVLRNLTEDKHLIEDDRFIPIVPAKLSVHHIICDYSSKFQRCFNTMDFLLDLFNYTLGFWLLHPLEKPKHKEMLKRYPSTPMSQIYGLPHLLRFIMKLPKLFDMYKNVSADILPNALYFVDGLFVYLVDEDYKINIANYDCVMPDYYRMAYS